MLGLLYPMLLRCLRNRGWCPFPFHVWLCDVDSSASRLTGKSVHAANSEPVVDFFFLHSAGAVLLCPWNLNLPNNILSSFPLLSYPSMCPTAEPV